MVKMKWMIKGLSWPFCILLCLSSQAQNQLMNVFSDSLQHFLWFTGKWSKTEKGVFMIAASSDSTGGPVVYMGGSGASVRVKPDGGVTIQSPGIDNWNKKIEDRQKDLDKHIEELRSPSNEQLEWSYHFNEAVTPQLDNLREDWKELKIDKKNDPLTSESKTPKDPQQNFDNPAAYCDKIKSDYQAIIDFYQAHFRENTSAYNNLPPPVLNFDCSSCDTSIINNNERRLHEYVVKFFLPESDLIQKGVDILKQLILMNQSDDMEGYHTDVVLDPDIQEKIDKAFHKNKKDPSKSGVCSYIDNYKLIKALKFLMLRRLCRADKLLTDNKDNYAVANPVIQVYIAAAKNALFEGFIVNDRFPDMASLCGKVLDHFLYSQLIQKHDWRQLANLPFIYGIYRQIILLGGNDNGFQQIMNKINETLNGFTINIEMDISVGQPNGRFLAHLKGKAKVAPEFHYSTDSCYAWVICEDEATELGLPIKKGSQKIDMDLIANEMVVAGPRPVYTGTKKYYCLLNQLTMNYCKPDHDSIFISPLVPETPLAGTWRYPDGQMAPSAINNLDMYFTDLKRLQSDAQSGKMKQAAEDYKKQAEKMIAEFQSMPQPTMSGKMDMSKIKDYQKIMNDMNGLRAGAGSNIMANAMNPIAFSLASKQNNSNTLFKKTFNAKEINPQVSNIIYYGNYTIDIEYKPKKSSTTPVVGQNTKKE